MLVEAHDEAASSFRCAFSIDHIMLHTFTIQLLVYDVGFGGSEASPRSKTVCFSRGVSRGDCADASALSGEVTALGSAEVADAGMGDVPEPSSR